jgi:hypothetical protein
MLGGCRGSSLGVGDRGKLVGVVGEGEQSFGET